MTNLAAVLEWKYGPVADTVDGSITAWRHATIPEPSASQLVQDTADYEVNVAKEAKTASLATHKAGLEASGVTHMSHKFDCSSASSGTAAAKLEMLVRASAANTQWIAVDNTVVSMTLAEFTTLVDLLVGQQDNLALKARAHKDNINALSSVAEIEAYDITANW